MIFIDNTNFQLIQQTYSDVMRYTLRHAGKYFSRQGAGVVLSAVCLAQKYDFDNNGITDADVERWGIYYIKNSSFLSNALVVSNDKY